MALSNNAPPRSVVFGKRLSPPLTGEQKAAADLAAREAERCAIRARTEAYLEARWEADRARFRACIRDAESAMARRWVGAMGAHALQAVVGFTVGLRLGR